jgi:hypothetical protein
MKRLHFWIILLAVVSSLAGFAAGELRHAGKQAPTGGLFQHYSDRMAKEFNLSPERERLLLGVLDRYERDLEDLKTRHLLILEPELVALGDTYRDLIRGNVLPKDERRAFDELVAGAPPLIGN